MAHWFQCARLGNIQHHWFLHLFGFFSTKGLLLPSFYGFLFYLDGFLKNHGYIFMLQMMRNMTRKRRRRKRKMTKRNLRPCRREEPVRAACPRLTFQTRPSPSLTPVHCSSSPKLTGEYHGYFLSSEGESDIASR